jgi:hypothetical protein
LARAKKEAADRQAATEAGAKALAELKAARAKAIAARREAHRKEAAAAGAAPAGPTGASSFERILSVVDIKVNDKRAKDVARMREVLKAGKEKGYKLKATAGLTA